MSHVLRGYLSLGSDWGKLLVLLQRHTLIENAESLCFHTIDSLPDESPIYSDSRLVESF